jgi:hypothetical protein
MKIGFDKGLSRVVEPYLVAQAITSPVLTSFTVQSRRTAFLPSVQNQVSISSRLRLQAADSHVVVISLYVNT